MQRSLRVTQKPLRYRESSPPRLLHNNKRLKRCDIDPEKVDRNDVDQALAVIASASECLDQPPILILTELSQFKANYVETRPGCSQYADLSELGFFKLFFSHAVIEILSEETNLNAEFHR
jgi:hypothetical protein